MTDPDGRRPINIFLTTFNRLQVLKKTVESIEKRTKYPFRLHVWDNGSDRATVEWLVERFQGTVGRGQFTSARECPPLGTLMLSNDNTYTLYPKPIFHSMVETEDEFYVVTDSDIEAPDMGDRCWLTRMLEHMRERPKLAVLAAMVPPVWLQRPYTQDSAVVYCNAVGNTLKVVRRAAIKFPRQKRGEFGDDTELCDQLHRDGQLVGYSREINCHNLGQKTLWGYASAAEYQGDPRKATEPPPFYIPPMNTETFVYDSRHHFVPGQQFQSGPPEGVKVTVPMTEVRQSVRTVG